MAGRSARMFGSSRPWELQFQRVTFSACRPQAIGGTDDLPAVIVKRMRMTLLQIDGLVAAILVELGAPYFVRALMLGWTEADGRP